MDERELRDIFRLNSEDEFVEWMINIFDKKPKQENSKDYFDFLNNLGLQGSQISKIRLKAMENNWTKEKNTDLEEAENNYNKSLSDENISWVDVANDARTYIKELKKEIEELTK